MKKLWIFIKRKSRGEAVAAFLIFALIYLLWNMYVFLESKTPKAWEYSQSGFRKTNICSNLDSIESSNDFILFRFDSILGRVPIYIHNPGLDYISFRIASTLNFEPHIFGAIHSYLKRNDEMNFIDVGANIGILSIQAALIGRKVISIDAEKSNIQHICTSMKVNNIVRKIYLIHNAVSDNHEPASIVIHKYGDLGVSFMDDENVGEEKSRFSSIKLDNHNQVMIDSMILDDLLNLPNIPDFQTVFLKLDVGGSEHKALLGARKLFLALDVKGVLMKWRRHVQQPESKSIILRFMKEFKFEPYEIQNSQIGSKLFGETMNNSDIVWLPNE